MDNSRSYELSDLLYALQIEVKHLESLMLGAIDGTRTKEDFQDRFHHQAWQLADNLKKIKPLAEAVIKKGYSLFVDESSISINSEEQVQSGQSEGMVDE
jgi:hypothetical protein